MGATAEVSIETKTLVTYNTPELVKKMLPSLEKAAGKENVHRKRMDDRRGRFFVLRRQKPRPSSFSSAECRKARTRKRTAAHHTPDFYIDDSRLDVGIKAFCNIVFDYQ